LYGDIFIVMRACLLAIVPRMFCLEFACSNRGGGAAVLYLKVLAWCFAGLWLGFG